MEPRLKSSTQWTPFPDEFISQIKEVAEDHFSEYEKEGRHFVVEGRIYSNEILLRLGLSAPQGFLRQDNFEASLEYDPSKEKALDLIHLLVDFLAEIWTTNFEDAPPNEDLPRTWTQQTFEKRNLFFRYSSDNTDLEKQADAILQINQKQLVYGEPSADGLEQEEELH